MAFERSEDRESGHLGRPTWISRGTLGLWAVLFAVWMASNGSLAIEAVATGAAITFALAVVFARSGRAWQGIRWTPRALWHFAAYTGTFVVELVRANISMMGYVYARHIDIRPGIIAIRTRLKSPIGRLALANSIALTPGSLVLDLKDDTLFIHWLDVKTTDPEEAREMLAGPFERHLEKIFG